MKGFPTSTLLHESLCEAYLMSKLSSSLVGQPLVPQLFIVDKARPHRAAGGTIQTIQQGWRLLFSPSGLRADCTTDKGSYHQL